MIRHTLNRLLGTLLLLGTVLPAAAQQDFMDIILRSGQKISYPVSEIAEVGFHTEAEESPQNSIANTSWRWEDPTHASFFPGSLAREERNLVLYSNGHAQMRDETCIWMGTDTLMHIMDYHHYTYTFNDATNTGVLSLYAMETYQEETHYINYMKKDYNFIYDPVANKLTVQDSTVMSDGHKELVERVFDNVAFKQSEQPQLPETPALTFVVPVTDWTAGIAEVRKYMAKNLPEFKEEVDETIGGTHYYYNNPKETISYEYVVKDGKLVS